MKSRFKFFGVALLITLFTSASAGQASGNRKVAPTGPLSVVQDYDGIVYLLFEAEMAISRYDTNQEVWLADLTFEEAPVTFTVSSNGLYIGYDRKITHIPLEGGEETHLRNFTRSLDLVFTYSDYVYGASGDFITSIHRQSGDLIDELDTYYGWQGVSVAPSIGAVFGRTSSVFPSDIQMVTLNADGTFGRRGESPYHGDFPTATKTYVFPGDRRVVDDSGTVYSTTDLTYVSHLGGSFDHLDFYGDLPIVLRDGNLFSYSNAYVETGRYRPETEPETFVVNGVHLFSFNRRNDVLVAEKLSIELFTPVEPNLPVDPNGLYYEPVDLALGSDGIVYLLSPEFLSVFRWSISEKRYLETIPLTSEPKEMVYDETSNALILAYKENRIGKIPLGVTPLKEEPFFNTPNDIRGLGLAGDFLYISDGNDSHLYDGDGNLVSQIRFQESTEIAWDETRRIIYFVDYYLTWIQIDEAGQLVDSGQVSSDNTPISNPIHIGPNDAYLLFGTGAILGTEELAPVNTLSNDITHAQWRENDLVTLREWDHGAQIQRWDTGNYALGATHLFSGLPLGLFSLNDQYLVVTGASDGPAFFIGDAAFQGFPEESRASIDSFTVSAEEIEEGETVTLSWSTTDATDVFLDGVRVASSGTLEVTPRREKTTYRLVVNGPGGGASAEVTIEILVPPPFYGWSPPMFLNSKNFWLNEEGDLHLLFPDPNSDGASLNREDKPALYVFGLRKTCNSTSVGYVYLEEGEAWPKLVVIPADALPSGDYHIAVYRSSETVSYPSQENSSDLITVPAPTALPDASGPPADYWAYQRWLLHAPKQSGGFGATVKVENLTSDSDSDLQLVAFDSTGIFLAAEPVTTGAGQTIYRDLYGESGLFTDFVDLVSHIGIYDPADNTRVSLRYTATSSQFGAWTEETDFRQSNALGDRLEMEARANEASADGMALLNLHADEPIQAWLVYRDRTTSEVIQEVDLGTVAPGGKLLTVASTHFPFQADTKYSIETRDPEARISVLGLVFGGADFFTATPVHRK